MSFKHFASKNQLPGFYISGTLAENGLMYRMKYSGKKSNCEGPYHENV